MRFDNKHFVSSPSFHLSHVGRELTVFTGKDPGLRDKAVLFFVHLL